MKNIEVINLAEAGMVNLTYKGMEAKSGFKVYRMCKELARVAKEVREEQVELIKKTLGDRFEAFAKYQEWQTKNETAKKDGKPEEERPEDLMTDEEYKAAADEFTPLVTELFNAEAETKFELLTFEEYCKVAELNEQFNLCDMPVTMAFEGKIWKEE